MDALNKKTVEDIDVAGKKCACSLRFSMFALFEGTITNDKRIVAALPTIKYLLMKQGAKVLFFAHIWAGRRANTTRNSALHPLLKRLDEYLGKEVKLAEDENVVGR
jgi:phosphoglycerate kinase